MVNHKAPTPHLAQQLLKESITIPDMRKLETAQAEYQKGRNMELHTVEKLHKVWINI